MEGHSNEVDEQTLYIVINRAAPRRDARVNSAARGRTMVN